MAFSSPRASGSPRHHKVARQTLDSVNEARHRADAAGISGPGKKRRGMPFLAVNLTCGIFARGSLPEAKDK